MMLIGVACPGANYSEGKNHKTKIKNQTKRHKASTGSFENAVLSQATTIPYSYVTITIFKMLFKKFGWKVSDNNTFPAVY